MRDYSGANVLGGLAKGFAMGRQNKMDREDRKESAGLKKQIHNLALLKEKREAAKEGILIKLLEAELSKSGTPTPAGKPSFGESFGVSAAASASGSPETKNVSLTDQMAEGSVFGDMPPQAAALVKKLYGLDAPGAIRNQTAIDSLEERKSRNQQLSEEAAARLRERIRGNDIRERALTQGHAGFMDMQIPGVGTVKQPIPKIGALPGKTKSTEKEYAIPMEKLPLYRHTDTLEAPPVGMTPKQAEAAGYNKVTQSQLEKIISFNQVDEVLASVEQMMTDVFPKTETGFGRIPGAIARTVGAATQTNVEAAKLQKFIQGTLAPVIRTMGEKGALSDTDVKRAQNLFASLTDRADVAWGMLEELKSVIARNKAGILGGKKGKKKVLTDDMALEFLKQAGGDRAQAEKAAKDAGYSF